MSTFAEKIAQEEKLAQEQGYTQKSSGDWYKFEEGDNVFRVLSEPEMIFEKFKVGICYTGCNYEGTSKFMTYVLDRKDNKIKIAKLPYNIGKTIAGYQLDEDYSFEGFPMPYDIKVSAKNAGTKEVEYNIIPKPKREEISSEITEELSKLKSIPDIVQKMKENKKKEHIEDGSFEKRQKENLALKEEIASARAGQSSDVPTIEYPDDEISPEDIPF
jgi:hypothetical protein